MKKFTVAYVPIGVATFDLDAAGALFEESIVLLKSIHNDVICPSSMLLSISALQEYLGAIDANFLIVQNITFANAAYIGEITKQSTAPLLLWTLREPTVDGGRLRLNSLTGAYSAANALLTLRGGAFSYILGMPHEMAVVKKIEACIKAAEVKNRLTEVTIASIGHTPEGFGFGRALDIDLLHVFGVNFESIEARQLMDSARAYSEEEVRDYLSEMNKKMVALERINHQNTLDAARLYKAYDSYVKEKNIVALASRCWPDFFTNFGTPVCAILGMLNEMGVAASCEADVYGALSMYIAMRLSHKAVFFGDPVSIDEDDNSITYWHCGTAACSLAHPSTGATMGLHPNRKIGPVMDFGCYPAEEVTIFRIGRKANGAFRIFLMKGKALDRTKQFTGTTAVVQIERPIAMMVEETIKDGWEPHFVVIYSDEMESIKVLAQMLNLEVCIY